MRKAQITVPEQLKSNVERALGTLGTQWLQDLAHLVNACIARWNLSECRPLETMRFNYVCFAHCPDYGEVALKVGPPHPDLYTEMQALSLYGGNNTCKIYRRNFYLGAMLLERVMPGNDLTTLSDNNNRIAAAGEIISALPVSINQDCGLPTLTEVAARSFARLRNEHPEQKQMLNMMHQAERLIQKLHNSRSSHFLLHGDLNHYNILQDDEGKWRAIDPKGLVSVPCMETARFIINEMDLGGRSRWQESMDRTTASFARCLDERKSTIAQCAFVDKVLSTCWKFEDNDRDDLKRDIYQCMFMQAYYEQQSAEEDR